MGPKFVQSFKDQAMCISGQIAAAANAATQHPGQRVGLGRGLGLGERLGRRRRVVTASD